MEQRALSTTFKLAARPDIDAWGAELQRLRSLGENLVLTMADAIVFGIDHYGEDAWQYLDELGYAHETVRQLEKVARQFPPDKRIKGLTFKHYRAALKFKPGAAAVVLKAAAEAGISASEFERRYKKPRDKEKSSEDAKIRFRCPQCDAAHVVVAVYSTMDGNVYVSTTDKGCECGWSWTVDLRLAGTKPK